MDDFRRFQKCDCLNGGTRRNLKYGCPCCRKIPNLNKFKKVSRRMARRRFSQQPLDD